MVTLLFLRSAVSKRFPSSLRRKAAFSNSSGFKSVFEKLRCCDGLVNGTPKCKNKNIKLRFKFQRRSVWTLLRRERMHFHCFAKNHEGQKSLNSV